MTARAQDLGDDPKYSDIDVNIHVIRSYKKAPSFLSAPQEPIKIPENFVDFNYEIVKLETVSNIPDSSELLFNLLIGDTEQTNSRSTFRY